MFPVYIHIYEKLTRAFFENIGAMSFKSYCIADALYASSEKNIFRNDKISLWTTISKMTFTMNVDEPLMTSVFS